MVYYRLKARQSGHELYDLHRRLKILAKRLKVNYHLVRKEKDKYEKMAKDETC